LSVKTTIVLYFEKYTSNILLNATPTVGIRSIEGPSSKKLGAEGSSVHAGRRNSPSRVGEIAFGPLLDMGRRRVNEKRTTTSIRVSAVFGGQQNGFFFRERERLRRKRLYILF